MNKIVTLAAASVLALGAAACHKGGDNSSSNVSAEDNMLVPADENAMGGDMNSSAGGDNAMGAMGGNDMGANTGAGDTGGNASNAM